MVVTDLLVVTEEIVPLVVALVLAAMAAMRPAVVLDPFPPELSGFGDRSGFGPALIVESLSCDEG